MTTCVRVKRNVDKGTTNITTFTATQCIPKGGQERLITAFIRPEQLKPGMLSKKITADRDAVTLAKQEWKDIMRTKDPNFKAKQYKYIILASVEG